MKYRFCRFSRRMFVIIFVLLTCGFVFAQTSSGPINLDRALREDKPTETDRAASYYHYILAKSYENNEEPTNAISEMRLALEANPASSAIYYELAALYLRQGNVSEATGYANESIKLDPENPDPHWLLIEIQLRSRARQQRGGIASGNEALRLAMKELEILEKLTPDDERVYYTLGGVYLETGEIDKAIAAYEKYQKYSDSDNGYREIARYYANANEFDKAIQYLNKGLEQHPDSAESLVMLGSIYLSQGKNSEGAAAYKKLFEISNGNVQILRELAGVLFEREDYKEAASVLEELAKKAQPDRVSQVLLGSSYFQIKRYSDAIRIFNEVLARVPDDVDARFYLAESYAGIGRYEDAAKIYEGLLRDKENPGALKNRAVFMEHLAGVLLDLENYERAISLYEEVAKITPTPPNARFNLLNAYRISEQYDKGIARSKEFLEQNPDNIYISMIYARILADSGRKKECVDYLAKLLQAHPDSLPIYIVLSEIYRSDKRYSDAEKVLLSGEERIKSPETAVEQLKFHRATTYEQQKSFDRAERLFREILDARPDNATVLNYLGYMLADRGVRIDEAISYIGKALEIEPENGAYLDSLGWAYFKLNDMEKAEKYLLEAASIVPKDPTIHDHLGDLYFKTGQLEKAREYWTESIRISKDPEEIQKVRRKLNQIDESPRRKNSSRK